MLCHLAVISVTDANRNGITDTNYIGNLNPFCYKGDIWVPDRGMDGGEGWRVHSQNGEHRHVYSNGKVRAHRYDSEMCWDLSGYNLYETTLNGEKCLTDVPLNYTNYYNNKYYFMPMPGDVPMLPNLFPVFGI